MSRWRHIIPLWIRSCGSTSYIGNGLNSMVKSIAERMGVRMPTFFGYMGWWILTLTVLFVGVTLLFLR